MQPLEAFSWGMFGGLAPILFEFASSVIKQKRWPSPMLGRSDATAYVVAIAVKVTIGGIIAVGLSRDGQVDTVISAITAGATAGALIEAFVRGRVRRDGVITGGEGDSAGVPGREVQPVPRGRLDEQHDQLHQAHSLLTRALLELVHANRSLTQTNGVLSRAKYVVLPEEPEAFESKGSR